MRQQKKQSPQRPILSQHEAQKHRARFLAWALFAFILLLFLGTIAKFMK